MITPVAENYDLISILLHWLIALFVIALFISGIWMVGLDYYSPWYQLAPWWHKGIGTVTFVLVFVRFLLRRVQKKPAPLSNHQKWQNALSKQVQALMNLLVMVLMRTIMLSM